VTTQPDDLLEVGGVQVRHAARLAAQAEHQSSKPVIPLDLAHADPERVMAALSEKDGTWRLRYRRRHAAAGVLKWLATAPGETWTDRWNLLGATEGWEAKRPTREQEHARNAWAFGVTELIGVGALTVDWDWYLRPNQGHNKNPLEGPDTDGWAAARAAMTRRGLNQGSTKRVTRLLVTLSLKNNSPLGGLTPAHVVEYAAIRLGPRADGRRLKHHAAPGLVYQILWEAGLLPKGSPAELSAITSKRRTARDLVSAYSLRTTWFNELLIMYVEDALVSGTDFVTAKSYVRVLGGVFWRAVEEVDPDPNTLHLSGPTATSVKARMRLNDDGTERLSYLSTLFSIRAFYNTIRDQAADDPRYVPFVAPSPVRSDEFSGWNKHQESRKAVQDQRTRDLTPVLPKFRAYTLREALRLGQMLMAARAAGHQCTFQFDGTTWTTHLTASDLVNITDTSGNTIRLSRVEDEAFWTWAFLEVLNSLGPRIEEVTELTERSIVLFETSKGKVPLLHITPSKTNRERLIPINQDLLTVLKQILRRHKATHGRVPSVSRWDRHEEVWSPPMPFLFQTLMAGQHRVLSAQLARKFLAESISRSGILLDGGEVPTFKPHDLRRLWTTRAVNTGLPVHVAAAILGHKSLETTRGYIATFTKESLAAYQNWIAHLRSQRPAEEYHDATPKDLAATDNYLTGRAVQGGQCTRTYDTDCSVGHNCRRCPLVALGPDARTQLAAQHEDSQVRLDTATTSGWTAEAEGHLLDLQAIRGKQADVDLRDAAAAFPAVSELPGISSSP